MCVFSSLAGSRFCIYNEAELTKRESGLKRRDKGSNSASSVPRLINIPEAQLAAPPPPRVHTHTFSLVCVRVLFSRVAWPGPSPFLKLLRFVSCRLRGAHAVGDPPVWAASHRLSSLSCPLGTLPCGLLAEFHSPER